MTEQQGVIRGIEWRDLFPWFILFRTFRIAIAPSLLALATAAVIISPLGWWLADRLFQPFSSASTQRAETAVLIERAERRPRALESSRRDWRADIPRAENSLLARRMPLAVREYLPAAKTALLETYFDLAEPLARLFQLRMTIRETAYYAFGVLWTLAIWALPGGAITRRAIVQLATDAPLDTRQHTSYAARRYAWYFLTPLYPLLGILLLALPIAVVGLLVSFAPGFGSLVAGLVWLLVGLAGLAAMWLLGGLIFGWPLMWPTISAERDGDPFEAFSRSYSYVYGKPLHYFFYVIVAVLFGALCWAVVEIAMLLVREFGFWALAWGGAGEEVAGIRDRALAFTMGVPVQTNDRLLTTGTVLIGLVVALIQYVAIAFRYTYFFCAASAIYLLLRHDVDEKEMDEVYLDSDQVPVVEPVADHAPSGAAAAAQPASDD